jgi:hypothetical protein
VVSVVVPLMLAVLPYMREVAGSNPGLDPDMGLENNSRVPDPVSGSLPEGTLVY